MTEIRHTVTQGTVGLIAAVNTGTGFTGWGLREVLAATISILMICNLALDLRRKWRNRNATPPVEP